MSEIERRVRGYSCDRCFKEVDGQLPSSWTQVKMVCGGSTEDICDVCPDCRTAVEHGIRRALRSTGPVPETPCEPDFKPGQKVRCIVGDYVTENCHLKYGEIYTVSERESNAESEIFLKEIRYTWPKSRFELVEEEVSEVPPGYDVQDWTGINSVKWMVFDPYGNKVGDKWEDKEVANLAAWHHYNRKKLEVEEAGYPTDIYWTPIVEGCKISLRKHGGRETVTSVEYMNIHEPMRYWLIMTEEKGDEEGYMLCEVKRVEELPPGYTFDCKVNGVLIEKGCTISFKDEFRDPEVVTSAEWVSECEPCPYWLVNTEGGWNFLLSEIKEVETVPMEK